MNLRCILKIDDLFYSTFQERMMHENEGNKTHLFISLASKCIISKDSDNYLISSIKHKCNNYFSLTTKTEVLSSMLP